MEAYEAKLNAHMHKATEASKAFEEVSMHYKEEVKNLFNRFEMLLDDAAMMQKRISEDLKSQGFLGEDVEVMEVIKDHIDTEDFIFSCFEESLNYK